jgi:protein-tyrosine phosphatase
VSSYHYVLPPQLAQGSAPRPGTKLPFDVLVLCAEEYQPPSSAFPGVQVMHVPMDDSLRPTTEDIVRAIKAARRMKAALLQGQRILCTCWMGRNRSGLVNGIALVELGYPVGQVIRRIKRARGVAALSNPAFTTLLRLHARALGQQDSQLATR